MKIAFLATDHEDAQHALAELSKQYGNEQPKDADIIVVLGGDGFLLENVHQHLKLKKPIYGMNCGSVGFLMNTYSTTDLRNRLKNAQSVELAPLKMTATTEDGETITALAFNEVSLLRQTRQAAKLRILVDGKERLEEMICDGAMVATPAGSTAYNLSAHGPIIPLKADALALTPIAPFRPRRWRGAILPSDTKIRFEINEQDKRPVSATADFTEVRRVVSVDIEQDHENAAILLFDADHSLDERIIREQFIP